MRHLKKTLEVEINKYEKPIKEIIGKSISKVNYFELDYGEPAWDENDFHSLDYGIEIMTSDKSTFYFIWDRKYAQFDIKFQKGSILSEFGSENNSKKYNVTNNEKWTELIDTKIIKIESSWSYFNHSNDKKRNYFPQDVRIDFENGKEIWISALEIIDNKELGMKDHLTIVFDKKIASKFNIGIRNFDL